MDVQIPPPPPPPPPPAPGFFADTPIPPPPPPPPMQTTAAAAPPPATTMTTTTATYTDTAAAGTQDRVWLHPWTVAEMRENASQWSLAGDNGVSDKQEIFMEFCLSFVN